MDDLFKLFPRTVFAGTETLKSQLNKIAEEITEIDDAANFLTPFEDAVETFDVMQACVTRLIILQDKFDVALDDAHAYMIGKNKLRGMYAKDF